LKLFWEKLAAPANFRFAYVIQAARVISVNWTNCLGLGKPGKWRNWLRCTLQLNDTKGNAAGCEPTLRVVKEIVSREQHRS